MDEKELRKSYRRVLETLIGAGVDLEKLDTPEHQEILRKFPIDDGLWRHPQAHILERVAYFLDCTKKSITKIIEALPKERKSKNDKKVVFEDKNNEKRKERKGAGSSVSDPGTKKRGRKPKVQAGDSGDDNKRPGSGVQQEVQRTRKRSKQK